MRGLLAALALGLVAGPFDHGKPVTEMRLSYRGLIVGEWEGRETDGSVMTLKFSRAGRARITLRDPDGEPMTADGAFLVDGRQLTVNFDVAVKRTADLLRLDGRELVLRWNGAPEARRFRRR